MATQFDFQVPVEFEGYDWSSLQAFKRYHADHPELWRLFTKYAVEMKESGRSHYGAKSIMERIRWEQDMKYPDKTFKICNSFTAFYSRLLAYNYPEFKSFFRFRQAKGIRVPHVEAGDVLDVGV